MELVFKSRNAYHLLATSWRGGIGTLLWERGGSVSSSARENQLYIVICRTLSISKNWMECLVGRIQMKQYICTTWYDVITIAFQDESQRPRLLVSNIFVVMISSMMSQFSNIYLRHYLVEGDYFILPFFWPTLSWILWVRASLLCCYILVRLSRAHRW